jgi:uncharacterized protein with NRDE domain
MCLLAILWRVVEDAPIIVAANREEAYARPGTPPQLIAAGVPFVAGIDPQAGGTWLGVNAHGLLVAVTNGRKAHVPPQPRSRGLMVRDLLQCRTAAEASSQAIRELETNRYAGCNLVCADLNGVHVIHAGDWLRVHPLPPGIHVMTNGNVNNTSDRRLAYALGWLGAQVHPSSRDWLAALRELCAHRGTIDTPPICLHGDKGGTVSSSVIALRQPLQASSYYHAQGPPDRSRYEDYSHLLRDLPA